jgi:hypothetical protein
LIALDEAGNASAALSENSKAKPKPKSHHIVPRLHLKHFAGDQPKGQVWTYDKNTGARRSAIPDETATFTNFYSFQLEDGTYDTSVEDVLAANESDAAPLYRMLIEGEFPKTSQGRSDFSFFLAYLYFRTKAAFRDAANIIGRGMQIMNYAYGSNTRAFEGLIRRVEKERGESMPLDEKEKVRRQLVDPSSSEFFVPRERAMMSLELGDKLAQILFSMRWSLGTAKHGFFITSDNPLIRMVDPASIHPIYGDGGFINRTVQVTLALDPRTILILSQDEAIPERFLMTREGVEWWNRARALDADEFLYSHIEHSDIARLAMRFKGLRRTLTTEGFGPEKWGKVVMPRKRKLNSASKDGRRKR